MRNGCGAIHTNFSSQQNVHMSLLLLAVADYLNSFCFISALGLFFSSEQTVLSFILGFILCYDDENFCLKFLEFLSSIRKYTVLIMCIKFSTATLFIKFFVVSKAIPIYILNTCLCEYWNILPLLDCV